MITRAIFFLIISILLLVLVTLSGCAKGGDSYTAKQESSTTNFPVADSDSDGIPDVDDQWPMDPTRPVISSLWGVNGEHWQPNSRLPFVAFAGYHEGKENLPNVSRIVANVLDYGATNTEGSSNDTAAFQAALTYAVAQVSASNPGVLLVPAGVYDVDEQLHLRASGLVLRGQGREASKIRFTRGLINNATAITPDDANRRKLVVMGGGFDSAGNLCTGTNWKQWNSNFSAPLDVTPAYLPKRGDFKIRLQESLNLAKFATFKANIIQQGYRIRLAQAMNYGETSTTPLLAESVYGGSKFAAPGSNGGVWMAQQFVVSISNDGYTLTLDRPLRFSPSNESHNGGVRIAVRDNSICNTEEIGIEHLTLEMPATAWIGHFGTEGQGGIDVLSDNSWIKDVRLINADNGIETTSNTFNNTITGVILSSTRTPRLSGSAPQYHAYGHHGISARGRDHLVSDFKLEVSYVHDATMSNSQGCVMMKGQSAYMNMDHHRQAIYGNVWTEMSLGNSSRMWDSTGDPHEGYNSAAYNTYWNIRSDTPAKAYWPEDSINPAAPYPQWGNHVINVIGTEILSKPAINADALRYPYPYNPDNAHLEVVSPNEIWPQNIYEAQVKAYKEGRLF